MSLSQDNHTPQDLAFRKARSSCLRTIRLVMWPAIVILGQVVVLSLSWGFFAWVAITGPINLPDGAAENALKHPKLTTTAVTLCSTGLSLFTAFLFSHAIRYSLTTYLFRPMSMFTLSTCINISKTSVVLNTRHPKWTITAVLFCIASGMQTAGWTTLLTPTKITIITHMTGTELDIGNDAFLQSPGFQQVLQNGTYLPGSYASITSAVQQSGLSAAGARGNSPGTLTFNHMSYMNSTGGILPANLIEMHDDLLNSTTMSVRTNLTGSPPHTKGFSTSYTMHQQGFTADVSCRQHNLSSNSSDGPPFAYYASKPVNVSDFPSVNLWQWSIQCGTDLDPEDGMMFMTSTENNWVFSLSCNDTVTNTFAVLLQGLSVYDKIPPTLCEVTPKVTVVQADYSGIFINVSDSQETQSYGFPVGLYAIQSLNRLIFDAQGICGNSFGDEIGVLLSSVPRDLTQLPGGAVNTMLEAYIKGMVEFSGTVIRTVFSETNNTIFSSDGFKITSDMMRNTSGTFRTETMGWEFDSVSVPLLLIPTTVIALVSVVLVLISLTKIARHPTGTYDFDPADPIHLMVAASAGGLTEAFPNGGRKDVERCDNVRVKLGMIDGEASFFREAL